MSTYNHRLNSALFSILHILLLQQQPIWLISKISNIKILPIGIKLRKNSFMNGGLLEEEKRENKKKEKLEEEKAEQLEEANERRHSKKVPINASSSSDFDLFNFVNNTNVKYQFKLRLTNFKEMENYRKSGKLVGKAFGNWELVIERFLGLRDGFENLVFRVY